MKEMKEITPEVIETFIGGRDEQKRIVNIEFEYNSNEVTVISRNDLNKRIETKEPFYPFLWSTQLGAASLYGGDKSVIRQKMMQYGINARGLNIYNVDKKTTERMEKGYRVLFYANRPLSYTSFLNFFKEGGIDVYDSNRQYLCVNPVEQFMIHTGKRQFKGFDDYDDLLRFSWDIETQGLNPKVHRIDQIGLRTNAGFEHIIHTQGETEEEIRQSEINAIELFFDFLNKIDPDIVTGHNSENFDWWFLMERCEVLGVSFSDITKKYLGRPIYKKKKKTVLKLGGEIEYFNQTVFWGHTIIDSLHACRRTQAIDSNMKFSNLKYAAEYAKVKKTNRVYVKGEKIGEIWNEKRNIFVLNDLDGSWYKTEENVDESTLEPHLKLVNGEYIVNRYLMDDLYESDKVELYYNQSNFQLAKILPMSYQKCSTAGTAGTWKMLLLAWSYENDLAVPMFGNSGVFTGGLSRLLSVGFIKDVVKLDYNSLYPAITLSFDIFPDFDISGIFKSLLDYVLTQREKYKGLMKKANKNAANLKETIKEYDEKTEEYRKIRKDLEDYIKEGAKNDKLQLPFKIFGNSFFGSYGAPNIFPWGSLLEAEEITCTARQCLRLMVKWFEDKRFKAIVGDTDGFNFSYSDVDLNYTYIGKGLNRNTEEGKEYKGIEAYVAEFNDLFMRHKMGLGIDEYAPATINFARKNYADLLEDGKVKLVGNTIKSKKMPVYIEKFLDENIRLLLADNGKQFLSNYYDYIEKIYNGNIPLREIASKGKIKKTIEEYKRDIMVPNKSGGSKGRQAWYELVIEDGVRTEIGETIYYVNTGTKKGEGDVKKEPIYKIDNNGNFITTDRVDKDGNVVYAKKGNPPKPLQDKIKIGENIILNCVRIDNTIIDADYDIFGTETDLFEEPIIYNYAKYIEQFNNRIKPLLVCFDPKIRGEILISNPEEKKYFTESESKLCAGFPNKPQDQDTLEQLLTMEDKEIKFWLKKNKPPVFIKELEVDWEEMVKDYNERMEIIKNEECLAEKEKYDDIISKISRREVEKYIDSDDEAEPPLLKELFTFLELNNKNEFISIKHKFRVGILDDILSKNFFDETDDD